MGWTENLNILNLFVALNIKYKDLLGIWCDIHVCTLWIINVILKSIFIGCQSETRKTASHAPSCITCNAINNCIFSFLPVNGEFLYKKLHQLADCSPVFAHFIAHLAFLPSRMKQGLYLIIMYTFIDPIDIHLFFFF